MHGNDGGDLAPQPDESTHSTVTDMSGNLVQARDVRGGVHFHIPTAPGPRPRQLPADVRGFINRTQELELLDTALSDPTQTDFTSSGMLLVAGTAGVGKTSVAVHWSHRVRDRFPDGQLYVNLRGYDAGEPVSAREALERFLRALDVAPDRMPTSEEARADLFRTLVAERRMLIVLDNAATAEQVRPLVPGTDGCLVLVTSRNRLSSLAAHDGARRISLDTLSPEASVTLLQKATEAHRHGDSDEELAELARLCAYLPLALRIAAERAASRPRMPLRDLIAGLRDESSLWDALSTDEDGQSGAVRTVFAWSYRALTPEASLMFRLLGLHPGPEFSVHAAAALAGLTLAETRRRLDALVGAHLLEETEYDRYQFHDLLRAYAMDQARDQTDDERRSCTERLFTWYLRSAAAAEPRDRLAPIDIGSDDATMAIPVLETPEAMAKWYHAERTNLLMVAEAAFAAGMDRIAWQLPAVVQEISPAFDPIDTWTAAKERGLKAARRLGNRYGEATLLNALAIDDRYGGRLDRARERYLASADAFTESGSPLGEVFALNGLGMVCLAARDLDVAETYLARGLSAARRLQDPYPAGLCLMNLGWTWLELGVWAQAEELLTESIGIMRELGQRSNEAAVLNLMSRVRLGSGRIAEARVIIAESLAISAELGERAAQAFGLIQQARIALAGDDIAECLSSSHSAATMFRRLGNRDQEAVAWTLTGRAYLSSGRAEDAIPHLRRSTVVHERLNSNWFHAEALVALAAAHDDVGETEAAEEHRRKASAILARFQDPIASAVRAEIER